MTIAPRLVFVPSPYVGPVSCRPMLRFFSDSIAADYGGVSGPDWYEGVARRVAAESGGRWIAVLHSGAGGFAPSLAAAAHDLAGFVFVDAVLPYPGKSIVQNAPPLFVERLRELTTDGHLAPWNEWFEPDPTLFMIPDANLRAAFVAELPRVPFAFLEAASPAQAAWAGLPRAYLQLSAFYAKTADEAEQRGWPVRRADIHHLAMTGAPEQVAPLLGELVALMG